jgi:integrase/recombinase XerD
MRIKIREPKQLPRALNIHEVGDIFKSVYKANITTEIDGGYSYFTEIRNIAVIELLFATGGRVSEISNLKDNQIDLNSGQVVIKGKGDKERIIQICNRETIALLKKYRKISFSRIKNAGNYFLVNRFNNKLSDQSIRTIVNTLSKSAKIQSHVTPHVFRHSFATLLLEKDVDIKYIQSMLGHSSIMTTQIYTHVNKEKQKQILKAKHPRKDFSVMISSESQ